jgi:hypothetical protein
MSKIQLYFHHTFRHIWNAIFIITYPILATFGILFIGITVFFSWLSQILTRINPSKGNAHLKLSDWEAIPEVPLIEAKLYKQIMFGPSCYQFRRSDGIPSLLDENFFGKKVRLIASGILLEKWNTTDSKLLPDFDICLYDPDEDSFKLLTQLKCFDWHISELENEFITFKWFDGTQGGEVKVSI